MAAVEVIEDVARSSALPMSPEDINEETKKSAEDIKEKANACFKSSDCYLFCVSHSQSLPVPMSDFYFR